MARILIIDDRPVNRQFLTTLLGYQHHDLSEASDGAEGLRLARELRPELIISDVLMPTMDGYEFVKRLRQEPDISQTPVVFSTAHYLSRESQALAKKCGVTSIIYKPCEPQAVLDLVSAALSGTDAAEPAEAVKPEEFDQAHQQLLTNKLAEKADELRAANEKLDALFKLGQQSANEHSSLVLLQNYCDTARNVIGARWAAVAVFDRGAPKHFYSCGLHHESAAALEKSFSGIAILANLRASDEPVRLSTLEGVKELQKFAVVTSFLGLPLKVQDRRYGWLCVAGKLGAEEFGDPDERIALSLASQLAIAYENALLLEQSSHLVVELQQEISAHQIAERDRSETQASLAAIIDSAMDAIVTIGDDLRVAMFNKAAEKIFRCPSAEAIGQPLDRFIPAHYRGRHVKDIRKFGETGVTTRSMAHARKVTGVRADGQEFPLEASISQIEVAGEKLYTVIMRDITERISAEALVRESESRYHSLFDNMLNAFAYVRMIFEGDRPVDLVYLAVNRAFETTTGLTNVVGKRVTEVIPGIEKTDRELFEIYGRVARTGVPEAFEIWIEALKGWFSISAYSPQPDYIGVVFDVITPRKQAEQALRESEEQLRLFNQATNDMFWNWDLATDQVMRSTGFERVFGYAEQEVIPVIGWWKDRLHPEDRERVINVFQAAVATGAETCSYEYRFRKLDGSYATIFDRAYLIRDTSNKVVRAMGAMTDISERKLAEERIHLLNRVYAVLGEINQMIVRTSEPQKIFDEACRIAVETGKFHMVWIGRVDEGHKRIVPVASAGAVDGYLPFVEIDLDDPRTAVGPTCTAVREDRYVICNDIENDPRMAFWRDEAIKRGYRSAAAFPLKAEGKVIGNFNLYATEPLFFDAEEVQLLKKLAMDIAFAFEITLRDRRRRNAEDEVKRSEARLRQQAEILELGNVFVRDAAGRIMLWNRGAEELYGWSKREAIGRISHELLQTVFPGARAEIEMTISKHGHWDGELLHTRKDGQKVWVASRQVLHGDKEKDSALILEVNNDITQLKEAERALSAKADELASMTQQLWQASKLATMGELSASIAHELNNPLATVALRAETLLTQLAQEDEKRRPLEVIGQEVDRMARLVQNLLQFSRRRHRQVSTVEMSEEIANSIELISYHLRSRNIEIDLELLQPLPSIQADRQQLRQLFLNLLTNASDAMPKGGGITVRTSLARLEDEEAVAVEFVDAGEGIASENLPKIWEPFFTTKAEGKGTGLGLAICRRIVEEHGGEIEIENRDGHGAVVRIVFPVTIETDRTGSL